MVGLKNKNRIILVVGVGVLVLVVLLVLVLGGFLQSALVSDRDVLYFKNGESSMGFNLDFSVSSVDPLVDSLSLRFVDVGYSVHVYGPELDSSVYGRSGSLKGKCLATGTFISESKCCKAMGWLSDISNPGDGYDVCYRYEGRVPVLSGVLVGGETVLLSKDEGGWFTGDLSGVVNDYCGGVVSGLKVSDGGECLVPVVVYNSVGVGGVSVVVENVSFRDKPVVIINETEPIVVVVVNESESVVCGVSSSCGNESITSEPESVSGFGRVWSALKNFFSFKWL